MAMLNNIVPRDLIEDILPRLPYKSIQRFRSLSKSFDSLISTQYFAKKILVSFGSHLMSLDYYGKECSKTLDFPPKTPDNLVAPIIVGSCHGLVCLALQNDKDFYIWNPSSGEHTRLPDSCFPPKKNNTHYQFAYGFGYDSSPDDYKVVFGVREGYYFDDTKEGKVAIFSMRENHWRIIQHASPCKDFFMGNGGLVSPHYGCFLNGTLNWLVVRNEQRGPYSAIVGFDLKTERFFNLAMPERNGPCLDAALGVLDEKLVLSLMYADLNRPLSELWVMNEYGVGQSWIRLLNDPLLNQVNCRLHFPLCISQDDLVINNSTTTDDNVTGRRMCNICECAKQYHKYSYLVEHQAVVYLEGVVSPNLLRNACVDSKPHACSN